MIVESMGTDRLRPARFVPILGESGEVQMIIRLILKRQAEAAGGRNYLGEAYWDPRSGASIGIYLLRDGGQVYSFGPASTFALALSFVMRTRSKNLLMPINVKLAAHSPSPALIASSIC